MRHHATDDIRSGKIVRIDGNTAEGVAVTRWTVPDPTKPSQAQATNKPYVVPYEQLFPELMATRVTVQKIMGSSYRVTDVRTQPRPKWAVSTGTAQPH